MLLERIGQQTIIVENRKEMSMIQFYIDYTNEEVVHFLEQKIMKSSFVKKQYAIFTSALILFFLLVLFKNGFSFVSLLMFVVLLLIWLGHYKTCKNQVHANVADTIHRPVNKETMYTIQEDGVHMHMPDEDMYMYWSYFVSYGMEGHIFYLESVNGIYLVCHESQFSKEDFALLKDMAGRYI